MILNRIDIRYAGLTSPQEINYDRIFVDGSRHRIHLQTITPRVMLITREQRHGSFRVAFTRIGNQQGRFSGYMENVCSCPIPLFDAT